MDLTPMETSLCFFAILILENGYCFNPYFATMIETRFLSFSENG